MTVRCAPVPCTYVHSAVCPPRPLLSKGNKLVYLFLLPKSTERCTTVHSRQTTRDGGPRSVSMSSISNLNNENSAMSRVRELCTSTVASCVIGRPGLYARRGGGLLDWHHSCCAKLFPKTPARRLGAKHWTQSADPFTTPHDAGRHSFWQVQHIVDKCPVFFCPVPSAAAAHNCG